MPQRFDTVAARAAGLAAKPQAVPEQTGTGRQSGGFSPGLGLEVAAEGRDWMALGLGSAGRRPGLGLAWDWIFC